MSTTTPATDTTVANEIARQMGGTRRIAIMTGAKNFTADGPALIFQLPSGKSRDGINNVRITLDADDTYTVRFLRVGRAPTDKVTVVKEVSMIFADQLKSLFESTTGLYLSL